MNKLEAQQVIDELVTEVAHRFTLTRHDAILAISLIASRLETPNEADEHRLFRAVEIQLGKETCK